MQQDSRPHWIVNFSIIDCYDQTGSLPDLSDVQPDSACTAPDGVS